MQATVLEAEVREGQCHCLEPDCESCTHPADLVHQHHQSESKLDKNILMNPGLVRTGL